MKVATLQKNTGYVIKTICSVATYIPTAFRFDNNVIIMILFFRKYISFRQGKILNYFTLIVLGLFSLQKNYVICALLNKTGIIGSIVS